MAFGGHQTRLGQGVERERKCKPHTHGVGERSHHLHDQGLYQALWTHVGAQFGESGVAVAVRTDRKFNASRIHLLAALDRSLARLGVDYVDLWQLHAWDPMTPLDETLAAVDDAVRSGRVRYAGVSNYSGWQMAKAATLQQRPGHAPLHRLAKSC
jgi:aryl-alcohol dehydrogenase-like predicted oxidoreductase